MKRSAFEDNGSAVGLSSGITINSSERVSVEDSFFRNSSKFDINSLSCKECAVTGNLAWHPRPAKTVAVAAIRLVGGNTRLERNLIDCDGTGCNAAIIIGSTKGEGKGRGAEIVASNNVVLNSPASFLFGRGPRIVSESNVASGGERECGEKRFYAFTRLAGAEVELRGGGLQAQQIMQGDFSPRIMPAKEIAGCDVKQITPGKLPQVRGSSPAVSRALQLLFERELGRAPSEQEQAKLGGYLAGANSTIRHAVGRIRGLTQAQVPSAEKPDLHILPVHCWFENRDGTSEEVCVERMGEDGLVDGDTIVPGLFKAQKEGQARTQGLSHLYISTWPGGVIPYTIDPNIPANIRPAINAAVLAYNRSASISKVRWVPRTTESSWVHFRDSAAGGACGISAVGQSGGRQFLDLNLALHGSRCTLQRTLLHEMGHAAGLLHEQQRPDRDRFIVLFPANGLSSFAANYQIYSAAGWGSYPAGLRLSINHALQLV